MYNFYSKWNGGEGGWGVPCVQFRVDFGLDCDESYLEQNCGTEIYQLALIKAASPTGEKVSLILSSDGLFVCLFFHCCYAGGDALQCTRAYHVTDELMLNVLRCQLTY